MPTPIQTFAAQQTAYNDRLDNALSALVAELKSLNDLINVLQTTPGPISAEDQATLDSLQTRGLSFADKLEAAAGLTPPAVPTV